MLDKKVTTLSTSTTKNSLFSNRNFILLWLGQAISAMGDTLFTTTLVLWITVQVAQGKSWAPLAVSGTIVASTVPVFVVGPVAGIFVDRWKNKRSTMLYMDALRSILPLLLLIISFALLNSIFNKVLTTYLLLGCIYGILLLMETCSQFFYPSNFILMSIIVEKSAIPQATGLDQTTKNIAGLVGPPLGAILFFSIGYWGAITLNALSFLVSFVTIFLIRISPQTEAPTDNEPERRSTVVKEFREGLSFYTKSSVLTTLLISISLVITTNGALNTLNIFFLAQNLATSSSFYGFMSTAIGAGAILGSILATIILKRVSAIKVYWCLLLGEGLIMLVYARTTYFPFALVLLLIFGVLAAGVNVATPPLMLSVTPNHFLGRIMSIFSSINRVAYTLSVLLVGFSDSILLHGFHYVIFAVNIGPIDTIFTVVGILAIISGFYTLYNMKGEAH